MIRIRTGEKGPGRNLKIRLQLRGKGKNESRKIGGILFASVAVGLWMISFTGLSFSGRGSEGARAGESRSSGCGACSTGPAAARLRRSCRHILPRRAQIRRQHYWPDPTGANSGVWATPAGDAKGDVPEKLSIQEIVYDRMAHNLYSINYVWALIAGFLVMFMQAGFMMVETGLCRAKNWLHTAAMNLMIYPLGGLAFGSMALRLAGVIGGTVLCRLVGIPLSVRFVVAKRRLGFGAAVDAAGKATGAFTYGLDGYERVVLERRCR